ncbi:MAG: hypothetical protein WC489_02955 [Patescibacteria group bacterium]
MKKETVFAIFLGIGLGVVVSFVMIVKSKDRTLNKSKPLTNEKKTTVAVTESVSQIQTFKITQPQDRQIFNTKTVVIKGTSENESLIVVQSPAKDMVYQTKDDNFSIEMPLVLGENVISLTQYSKNSQGRSQQKQLRIYYLDEQ